MSIDYEDVISRINGIYTSCSPQEKTMLKNILSEIANSGDSETLERIWLSDFKEVPVSIDRFLKDPDYLGNTNDKGSMVYPGWWPVYRDIFNGQKDIFEVCLSGATRIGKTSTAVSCMAYMTYLIMCYKNPQKYFRLKDISRITIAFANLTKDLAAGVAFHEYQTTLKESPWFQRHGRFSNSVNNPLYYPEGDKIDIIPASDSAHVLGMQLWACLVGETQIETKDGIHTLEELEGTTVTVKQYDYDKQEYTYCDADVVLTKYTDELIVIELEDGSIIEGTPDHRIMLADGTYKQLCELTEDDDIWTGEEVGYE